MLGGTGAKSSIHIGLPNDEAIEGHPLHARGLKSWRVQEVLNSSWIIEVERRNSVHSQHKPELLSGLRHIIIAFKDEFFECLTEELRVLDVITTKLQGDDVVFATQGEAVMVREHSARTDADDVMRRWVFDE